MMEKKRIALAGCRGHVEKFGNLINSFPESETVAVWDNVPGRGEKVAENLGCQFEPDFDRLMSDYGLDGVVITAENALHKEMILKAAEQKVSTFVEKPLCVKPEEAYEIQKAVKESGITFYMTDPFVRRGTLKLKELMEAGTLGEITGATFRLGSDAAFSGHVDFHFERNQGGIMADVGGHMIHKAHFLFGKPESLCSVLRYYTPQAQESHMEDDAHILLKYPGNVLVNLQCSWVGAEGSGVEAVYGSKGFARVEPNGRGEGNEKVILQTGRDQAVVFSGDDLPANPTQHIRYFVEMLAYGIPNEQVGVDPLSNSGVSLDHAVEYVEMIDAIYRSNGKGFISLP
ncbi:MAG: Gfo/Idh/MocA family oxidoreductase [Lachnospiraceae bacterium]|nr:Gfo/Idh/MocA family oxidoreductase [Lachnospiraceae bacterium]